MTPVSDVGRALAQTIMDAFGTRPEVHRYYDADESHHVDVASAIDVPEAGLVAYSTIGVSDARNMLDERLVRVELALASTPDQEAAPNVLATAAFCVIKDGWLAAPGVTFPNAFGEYDERSELPHLLWVEPFPFPTLSSVPVAPEIEVHWLLGMAIAETERRFLAEHGWHRFEERLDGVDYWDPARKPIV